MKSKAAVLYNTNKPLKFVDIKLNILEKNQVLVKIIYSGFCSSQYGEITGIKGKDKFLPHCLGHEACGIVLDKAKNIKHLKKNDLVVLHWMKSKGKDCGKILYTNIDNNEKINSGKITTFSKHTIVSVNRVTKVKKNNYKNTILPLMGCSIPVAISTLEKILKIQKNKNILIIGGGALGLPMLHYSKYKKLKNIHLLEKNNLAIKKANLFGVTKSFKSINDNHLQEKLKENFYHYIADTSASSQILNNIFKLIVTCKVALLGVPKKNEYIRLNSLKINYGLRLLGSYGGNYKPNKDLKKYIDQLIKSNFPFNKYIQKIYKFKNLNKLISDYKKGKIVGKALIEM